MVYKKYIVVNGKRYGPYLYHSRKEHGKVISEYHGKWDSNNEKENILRRLFKIKNVLSSLLAVFLFAFLFSLIILIPPIAFSLTGNSSNFTTENKFDLVTFGNATTSDAQIAQRFIGGQQMTGAYNNTTTLTGRFGLTELDPVRTVAATASANLSGGIIFQVNVLPSTNLSADGNNGTGETLFNITVSAIGTLADLYIRADENLTSGSNVILLHNEKYSFNLTNASVPSQNKFSLTTSFSDNPLGYNLSDGTIVHLKFFLNVSGSQAAGTYNNTIFFRVVASGNSP
jgi:hypothetical protein